MTATWRHDDGGKTAAGIRGATGDCVCRAIAIVTGRPYSEIYALLETAAQRERRTKRRKTRSHPKKGVYRVTYERVLADLCFRFVPTLTIGSGCRVHLRAEELPPGKIIARLSRHLCAVIDGVIHDTHDPTRAGTRCVYGYFTRD